MNEGPKCYMLGQVDPEALSLIFKERDALQAQLTAMVDGYEADTSTIKQLQARVKQLEAGAQPANPQPDCRTCSNKSAGGYCIKSEHWMKGCTNGDQYQPAPAVVLWRTK